MIGLAASLLACGARTQLASESREVGTLTLAGRSYRIDAVLRAWHHGWSLDPGQLHGPYDAVYVSWEMISEPRPMRGALDQTWDLPSVAEGRARLRSLSLDRCGSDDLLAFRLIDGEPWRLLVPDEYGAVGAIAVGERCEDALMWAGSAESWRLERASDIEVCAHLYRTRRLDAAVRCLLREPARSSTRTRASRQDLPRAPNDPAFDGALLAALDPEAAGDRDNFSPERTIELLSEVTSRGQVEALARRWEAVATRRPWQQAIVDAYAPR